MSYRSSFYEPGPKISRVDQAEPTLDPFDPATHVIESVAASQRNRPSLPPERARPQRYLAEARLNAVRPLVNPREIRAEKFENHLAFWDFSSRIGKFRVAAYGTDLQRDFDGALRKLRIAVKGPVDECLHASLYEFIGDFAGSILDRAEHGTELRMIRMVLTRFPL